MTPWSAPQLGTTGAQPALGEGNAFKGNAEQDRITDGDLAVSDTALPVP